MTDVVETLRELVRIDSRNSLPLSHQGARPATEEAVCAFLEKRLAELGMHTERQYAAPDRPGLIAFRPPSPNLPTLAFEAHMDTVGVEGMTIDPFAPDVREGRLYGRGACDTKGSMAAMLVALRHLLEEKAPVNLVFIASCAEETCCEGAPSLDLSNWPIDGIVVGEPTSNQPILAHKAHAAFELICRGKAAHGARPEAGCNAIYRAADVLRYLREVTIPELAEHKHPFFEGSTLSVGMIAGGTKANIVPDLCTLTADLRLVPGTMTTAATTRHIAERATERLGFPVKLGERQSAPGLNTPPDCRLAKAACRAAEVCGGNPEPGAVSYCTDAGAFDQMGYPCIVMGPGSILQAHGAVEYIELEQLHRAVSIYAETARAFMRAEGPSPAQRAPMEQ